MAVSKHILESMSSSSWIRKMFEEGNILRAKLGADKVYDFSLGNPDLEPPDAVKKAIEQIALSKEKGVHAYMPNAGYTETRAAMAKKINQEQFALADSSPRLSEQHIIMAGGAAGALNAVFKALLESGDEVIVPAPYFAEYGHYVKNHGGVLKPVQTAVDFSLDVQAIEKALSPRTKVILINSPNNPTGKVYSDSDIATLSEILYQAEKKYNTTLYVLADEPYRDIVYNGKTVASLFPIYKNSIIVTSFAKNLSLPGERIGFIAVNPACEDALQVLAACIFTTRILGYVNAPAFFQRVIAQCWSCEVDYSSYAKRRDLLTAVLRKAGLTYAEPEGAFYLFCKVPERLPSHGHESDDIAFAAHLKDFAILAVPGTGFGCSGYVRLAYCVSEQTIVHSEEAFCVAIKKWRE